MLILIAFGHGLRVGELVAIRWDQVDLQRGTLHVNRKKTVRRQRTRCPVGSFAGYGSSNALTRNRRSCSSPNAVVQSPKRQCER